MDEQKSYWCSGREKESSMISINWRKRDNMFTRRRRPRVRIVKERLKGKEISKQPRVWVRALKMVVQAKIGS